MKTSKTVQITSVISSLAPLAEQVLRNGRIYTHQLILMPSASISSAIKAALEIERPADAKPATFCVELPSGEVLMQLSVQEVDYLARKTGVPVNGLALFAQGATYSASVELREAGDAIIVRGEVEGEIEIGHAQVINPKITLAPHMLGAVATAMFAQQAQQQPTPQPVAERVIVEDDAPYEATSNAELAEEAKPEEKSADAKKATAKKSTAKAKAEEPAV